MQVKYDASKAKNLSNYDIIGLLGRGANSFVYKAKSIQTGRTVVIKVMDISSPLNCQKVRREVSIHKRIKHSHIVEYIDDFRDECYWYLILEHCEKGELYKHLRANKGQLKEEEIRSIGLQLLNALKYLENHCILHLDLKLGNIFLDRKGRVKLGDFGLSEIHTDKKYINKLRKRKGDTPLEGKSVKSKLKLRSKSTVSEPVVFGTPNYVSPEILSGGQKSHKSDIWSLGCVLYVLASGRFPFEGKSTKKTIRNILKHRLTYPTSFSKDLIDLLHCMIEQKQEHRASVNEILSMPFFSQKKDVEVTMSTIDMDKFKNEEKTDSNTKPSYLKEVKKETIHNIVQKKILQRNKSLGLVSFTNFVGSNKNLKSKRQLKEIYQKKMDFCFLGKEGLKTKINFDRFKQERKPFA